MAPPTGSRVRPLLISAFRSVMRLYFRDIERVGQAPTADTRGRVFVSNHYNALIDPILVLTDAACEISPIAKSTLWKIPGLKWLLDQGGAVPIVRRKDSPDKAEGANDAAFDRIADHLATGGNILIFPEGTSHSEPQLAPLRTGAARMLEAADKRDNGEPLTFQAAALEFDARDDFRSRCLVLWGPVRKLDDVPGEGEERIKNVTRQMQADLKELLVEGGSHGERLLIARVAELLANNTGDASLAAWNGIGRQVELASQTLRELDAELIAAVDGQVTAYYDQLGRFGLSDAQLVHAEGGTHTGKPTNLVREALLAPLALAGFVLYAPPYFIPRFAARKTDHDAVSTVKLGAALVVYPLWMAGLVSASMLLPPPISVGAAAIAVTSPFAALRWLDALYKRAPRPPTQTQRAALVRLRGHAIAAIDRARAQLAPAS
jgi:1-acyl-sn-glycerol-3-phosphate acyltransferase